MARFTRASPARAIPAKSLGESLEFRCSLWLGTISGATRRHERSWKTASTAGTPKNARKLPDRGPGGFLFFEPTDGSEGLLRLR
jgi:hypothetical protein